MGDEKLAAIGAGAGICHGKDTGAVMFQARVEFIGKIRSQARLSRCQGDTRPGS